MSVGQSYVAVATTERTFRPTPVRTLARRRPHATPRLARIFAFAGTLVLVLLYALRGGSYDIVVFETHALVVWWVLAVGIAVGLLPRSRPPRAAMVLIGALLAYAAWIALSLIWSQSSERTTEELARTLGYAGVVALLSCAITRQTWRAAGAGLASGAFVVCVIALGSHLAPSVFPADLVDSRFHIDRLSYPFGYWNAVAAWGAMAATVGLAWSTHDDRLWRRALALGFVPCAGLVTYLTYSRAGVAGTAAGLIVVLVLSRNRLTAVAHAVVAGAGTALAILAARGEPAIAHASGSRGGATVAGSVALAGIGCGLAAILTGLLHVDRLRVTRRVFRPLAFIGVVALMAAAGALGPRLVRHGWHSFTHTAITNGNDPTARLLSLSGSRYPLWKSTLNAFETHPLDGTGAGTFEFWWDRHATNGEFVRDAHNLWLQNLAELGLPGALLMVAVAVAALAVAGSARWRARRDLSAGVSTAFAAAFVVFLVHSSVDWMWQSTAVAVLALAGVAVVGARGAPRRWRVRWRPRVLAVFFALVAGAVQLPGLISTTEVRNSQAAERAGHPAAALAWADDAITAEPWSASALEQRGLVLEAATRYAPAARDLRRAIAHEPTNYAHYLILARIEAEQGQLAPAVQDLRRARTLRPRARVFALARYFRGVPGSPFSGR